jgi:hypothetical protein
MYGIFTAQMSPPEASGHVQIFETSGAEIRTARQLFRIRRTTRILCSRAKQLSNDVRSAVHALPCTTSTTSKFIPNNSDLWNTCCPFGHDKKLNRIILDVPYILYFVQCVITENIIRWYYTGLL